ncbi:hypothetical protein BC834DRAFT_903463 [Gloeopeniophorella convolvens]|nr:hypothetical protein BC834DRAFT_903463 [Gloeopeniophorella convolvens]
MSTKAITSTLRHFVRRQPSLIDCDIWNQVVTKTPDQDRNEIASHILASLSWGYRSHHLRAPGPSSAQFWNAETYEELITLDRSSFPLCTEADHRRPVHPIPSTSTSSFDTQHARQLQRESALQFPRVARPGLSISISTPPHTPAVPAAAATTETGESPTSDAASTSTPVPSAALSSSAQEAHHSAALALTVPSSTAIVSLSIDRVDASGSAQSADAPSAVDTAPDGPIGRPSSDSLQLHGVVAAAAGIVSVDL